MYYEIFLSLAVVVTTGGTACNYGDKASLMRISCPNHVFYASKVVQNVVQAVYFQALKWITETNLPSGKTIVFEGINSNRCNGYSTSTGKFTAPKRGPYVFTWTVLTQDGYSLNVGLYRNSRFVSLAQSDGAPGQQNSSGSNTVVLELRKGYVIDLRVENWMPQNKHQIYGDTHSTFAGWSL